METETSEIGDENNDDVDQKLVEATTVPTESGDTVVSTATKAGADDEGESAIAATPKRVTTAGPKSARTAAGGETPVTETPAQILERRNKQIEMCKNTAMYKRYLEEVPKESRGTVRKHPRTPDPTKKCSSRLWDGLMSSWRKNLHAWDVPEESDVLEESDGPDVPDVTVEEEEETDEKEIAKRLKHLSSVKQTKQYKKYLLDVPKESRDVLEHPKTPDPTRKYASQQAWFENIKVWRSALAKFEPDWNELEKLNEQSEQTKKVEEVKEVVEQTTVEKKSEILQNKKVQKEIEKPTVRKAVEKPTVQKEVEKPVEQKEVEIVVRKRQPIVFDLPPDSKDTASQSADVEMTTVEDPDCLIIDDLENIDEEVQILESPGQSKVFDRLGSKPEIAAPPVDIRTILNSKKGITTTPKANQQNDVRNLINSKKGIVPIQASGVQDIRNILNSKKGINNTQVPANKDDPNDRSRSTKRSRSGRQHRSRSSSSSDSRSPKTRRNWRETNSQPSNGQTLGGPQTPPGSNIQGYMSQTSWSNVPPQQGQVLHRPVVRHRMPNILPNRMPATLQSQQQRPQLQMPRPQGPASRPLVPPTMRYPAAAASQMIQPRPAIGTRPPSWQAPIISAPPVLYNQGAPPPQVQQQRSYPQQSAQSSYNPPPAQTSYQQPAQPSYNQQPAQHQYRPQPAEPSYPPPGKPTYPPAQPPPSYHQPQNPIYRAPIPPPQVTVPSYVPPRPSQPVASQSAAYMSAPTASSTKGLDFALISLMNPGEEMLRYIQSKSYDYARELDVKYPDFRRMMGRTVLNQLPVGNQKVLPCGPYNKNDSCPHKSADSILHAGPVGMSIHACSLCYFCLGGLFNFHRQDRCPLLNTFNP